jgi:Protein of unknown function (DUF3301)
MELFALLFVALVCWAWYAIMQGREAALAAGKRVCETQGLQLLDDTVSMSRLRIRRNKIDGIILARVYRFEFTDTGDNRREGALIMEGTRLAHIQLEPYRLQ